MSAATDHVYRIGRTGWTHCHGLQAQSVSAWPRLAHSALVVLDRDDIFTDVWRFEGKAEYATALVEKRVRSQGLVEGAAHIVTHRLVKVPGGFQVYFSAVSLELWQQWAEWARSQVHHCMLMTAAGVLCHGVAPGSARLLLSQRRLMCFGHSEEGMVFDSTQALGSEPSAVANAAKVLTGNQRALLTRLGPAAVQWAPLWSVVPGDSALCLAAVQDVLGSAPKMLPVVTLDMRSQSVQTALAQLAHAAAGRHALNPLADHLAWRAESWVSAITLVTALTGVALVTAGMLVARQTDEQRLTGLRQRSELETLQSRITAVSALEAPEKLMPAADFSRLLDEGAHYDLMDFMALLKASAGADMRIHRIKLETGVQTRARVFRVDGIVAAGASASVTRWVSAMAGAGWSLKSIDPVNTAPGAFSYELVAAAAPAGGMK